MINGLIKRYLQRLLFPSADVWIDTHIENLYHDRQKLWGAIDDLKKQLNELRGK